MDTDVISHFKNNIIDMLQSITIQMKRHTLEGIKYDDTNLQILVKIIHKLLNEDSYLID